MSARPSGFASPAAVRSILRRMKLERRLQEIADLAPALVDMVHHRAEQCSGAGAALGLQRSDLSIGDAESTCHHVALLDAEGREQREKELLDGVNLTLKLLQTIGGEFVHGLFSSVESGAESNGQADAPHRLRTEGK